MDPWYANNLVCPVDHTTLKYTAGALVSQSGRRYPVVDGVPVMLVPDAEQTIGIALASLRRAMGDPAAVDQRAPQLYLESLGISEAEKEMVVELAKRQDGYVDPVVSCIIGATSGYSYKSMIGNLRTYPIPELRLTEGNGQSFLDLGCNWGRWSLAAARKGYSVVGVDPSLGAIMAARRVAQPSGVPVRYVVADARFLPFKDASFDVVFSYSVLQHLSKANVRLVVEQVSRMLKPGGLSLIQMPNFLGVRCLQHQARRRFRKPRDFEVRYWGLQELKKTFSRIGTTSIFVDCYFGLGLQESDVGMMPAHLKLLIQLSAGLRHLSSRLTLLRYIADSVYVRSVRT